MADQLANQIARENEGYEVVSLVLFLSVIPALVVAVRGCEWWYLRLCSASGKI